MDRQMSEVNSRIVDASMADGTPVSRVDIKDDSTAADAALTLTQHETVTVLTRCTHPWWLSRRHGPITMLPLPLIKGPINPSGNFLCLKSSLGCPGATLKIWRRLSQPFMSYKRSNIQIYRHTKRIIRLDARLETYRVSSKWTLGLRPCSSQHRKMSSMSLR